MGGHGVCSNFLDILFPKGDDTKFLKLSPTIMKFIRTLIESIVAPNDAERAREVHTGYRGYMSFCEEVECVTAVLVIVLPLALKDTPEAAWYLDALQELVQTIRWYIFGVAPPKLPWHPFSPITTFEEKARFAAASALRYAQTVEGMEVLQCMTYNLHSMVYHFLRQELEGGALCCDNELFGERFLKYLAALAKGKVQTNNVELTLAKNLRRLVYLADLEAGLLERGTLNKTYCGQQALSKEASAVLLQKMDSNRITGSSDGADVAVCFVRCMQELGVAVEGLPDTAYAVAHVGGMTFTSVAYVREHTRASFWVSYIHATTKEKAFAQVQFYVRVEGQAYAFVHELTLINIDQWTAITLAAPSYPAKVALLRVEQIQFKLNVLKCENNTIRAAECLHLRVDG